MNNNILVKITERKQEKSAFVPKTLKNVPQTWNLITSAIRNINEKKHIAIPAVYKTYELVHKGLFIGKIMFHKYPRPIAAMPKRIIFKTVFPFAEPLTVIPPTK